MESLFELLYYISKFFVFLFSSHCPPLDILKDETQKWGRIWQDNIYQDNRDWDKDVDSPRKYLLNSYFVLDTSLITFIFNNNS